jgi:hypothetical protein
MRGHISENDVTHLEGAAHVAMWFGGRSFDQVIRATNQHRLVLRPSRW